ncbi:MAG TPA: hypothetical protein ENI53_02535 [Thermoplasmatales archaeon]|nr:hypothetical protein [Thermoplasmatales archaeon]
MKKVNIGVIIIVFILPSVTTNEITIYFLNENGRTLYVGGIGQNNYTYIQDAIDAANDGDTIFVYDDSSPYYEDFMIYKSVNLIGENKNVKIIGTCLIISDYVNIKNFTFMKNIDNVGGSFCNISSCIFNSSYIILRGASNNRIFHCNFLNTGGGIALYGNNNHIFENKFIHCFEAIACDSYAGNIIENNNFSFNKIGIYLHGGGWGYGNTIRNNSFFENGIGIELSEAGGHRIYNNSFTGDGISTSGKVYESYGGNDIFNNTINGKPIIYLKEKSDVVIDKKIDAGQIILVKCSHITIKHQKINNTCVGIRLWDCRNCKIYENNVSNNDWGIWLQDSKGNVIKHNNFINNDLHAVITMWKGIYHNKWNRNYWDNWPIPLPKPIGLKNVDWLPLMHPYRWWK